MNRFLLIFLLLGLSACGTVRPVSSADSTKVEVRYEKVVEHDTAFVQLPVVVEKVAVLDTVSHLENKYAASSAVVSGGVLRHSLETKPVVLSAPVEKVAKAVAAENRTAEARPKEIFLFKIIFIPSH